MKEEINNKIQVLMNRHLVFIALTLLSITFSCKSRTEKEQPTKAVSETEALHGSTDLALDNGKRWIANPETNDGIAAMIRLVNDFKEGQSADKLKENLESEFQMIFQKCTMKGPAHDQLHNFLLPLKSKIAELKNTLTMEKIQELKAYLDNYYNYFE